MENEGLFAESVLNALIKDAERVPKISVAVLYQPNSSTIRSTMNSQKRVEFNIIEFLELLVTTARRCDISRLDILNFPKFEFSFEKFPPETKIFLDNKGSRF